LKAEAAIDQACVMGCSIRRACAGGAVLLFEPQRLSRDDLVGNMKDISVRVSAGVMDDL